MKKHARLCLIFAVLLCVFFAVFGTASAAESGTAANEIENLLTFDGYQARLDSYPGIRASFSFDKEKLASLSQQGYSVELGVIMAIYEDGRTKEDLAVSKSGDEYVVSGGKIVKNVIYKDGEYIAKSFRGADGKETSVFALVCKSESSKNVENYKTDSMYRAYLVLEKDGCETVIQYDDCDSTLFGDEISIYELSSFWKNYTYADNPLLNSVVSESDFCGIVYSPNGGLGYGISVSCELGEEVVIAAPSFRRAGYDFVGWSKLPDGDAQYFPGQVITYDKKSPRTLYAVWSKNTSSSLLHLDDSYDYDSYYVKDSLIYSISFFESTAARNETHPLTGDVNNYNNSSATAASRFTADSSNYSPFTLYALHGINVSGGNAKILTPWCFNDWFKDPSNRVYNDISTMRTELPTEGVVEKNHSGKIWTLKYSDGRTEEYTENAYLGAIVYSTKTVFSEDLIDSKGKYYLSDGKYSKAMYESAWGDKHLALGYNSSLNLNKLQDYLNTGVEDFTIQVINSFDSISGSNVYMFGVARYHIRSDGGKFKLNKISVHNGSMKDVADFTSVTSNSKISYPIDTTFTFDRTYSDSAESTNFGIYVDGTRYLNKTYATSGSDNVLKIGESSDMNVYAIRVYSDILTEKEMQQNHFVDIAKFYELDICAYEVLTVSDREKLHEGFAKVGFDKEKTEVQKILDEFFMTHITQQLVRVSFDANFASFDDISTFLSVKGKEIPTPDITLDGSRLLGWAESRDGDVVYAPNEVISALEDVTLYAIWEHNRYSVSYDVNGGTLAEQGTDSYVANDDVIALPIPTRDGYTFTGWYTDTEYENCLEKISHGIIGDLSLVAGWQSEIDKLVDVGLPTALEKLSHSGIFENNAKNILDRFEKSRAELGEQIAVLPRFEVNDYLISKQNQIFVAKNGNDKNNGTIDSPLATIEAALEKANRKNGAVIWIREGEYNITSSIDIGASFAYSASAPLIISAYKDERVVISTVKEIPHSAFSSVDYTRDTLAQRIPASAQDKILTVNLYELGFTSDDIGAISKGARPALFADKNEFSIARYPNAGETLMYITGVSDSGSTTARDGSWIYQWWIPRVQNWEKWVASGCSDEENYDWDVEYYYQGGKKYLPLYDSFEEALADAKKLQAAVDDGARVYVDSHGNKNIDYGWIITPNDTTPLSWVNDGNIWYYGSVFEGWERGYYNIKSFDRENGTITSLTGSTYGATVGRNSPTGHNDFYLFNAIEALDCAGEWYVDFKTGNLYVYPTSDFADTKITYASSNSVNAISVNSAKNVIINGLEISMTSGHGIYASGADGLVVQGCKVSYSGDNGIHFVNCKNSAITYNDVSYVNDTMINCTYSQSAYSLTPCNNVVQNNYCHSPKELCQSGILLGGCRTIVSHNELQDTRISFSTSSECVVEYNEIKGGSLYESDAGFIYMNGFYSIGNHIRYNYLHSWGTPGNGIYFDDLSSCNYAYLNIMDTTEAKRSSPVGFCYTSSGHYNVFFGNLLVGRDKDKTNNKESDRINVSALYYDDSAHLGYRFKGLSERYVSTFSSNYSSQMLGLRFPEIVGADGYLAKMKTHIEERAKAGYVRNSLEVYLRSPADNIIMNNVIIGCSAPIKDIAMTDGTPSKNHVDKNYTRVSMDGVFADYQNGDFSVSDGILSQIKEIIPSFEQLDTDLCGRTK